MSAYQTVPRQATCVKRFGLAYPSPVLAVGDEGDDLRAPKAWRHRVIVPCPADQRLVCTDGGSRDKLPAYPGRIACGGRTRRILACALCPRAINLWNSCSREDGLPAPKMIDTIDPDLLDCAGACQAAPRFWSRSREARAKKLNKLKPWAPLAGPMDLFCAATTRMRASVESYHSRADGQRAWP